MVGRGGPVVRVAVEHKVTGLTTAPGPFRRGVVTQTVSSLSLLVVKFSGLAPQSPGPGTREK